MRYWYKVNILGVALLIQIACSTSTEKPSQSKQIKTLKNSTVFEGDTFSEEIKKFSRQLSKINTVQKDTVPVSSLKNCGYNFFSAFTLKNNNQKNNIEFQFYSFNENTICKAAQQKLLNNLGDNTEVERSKNIKRIKSTPWYIIQNVGNLITMHYNCENDLPEITIDKLKEQLQLQFAKPKSEIVNVGCGGPLEWL